MKYPLALLAIAACAQPSAPSIVDVDAGPLEVDAPLSDEEAKLIGAASARSAVGMLMLDGARICSVVKTSATTLTTAQHCTNGRGAYTAVFRSPGGVRREVSITHRRLLSSADVVQLQFTGSVANIPTLAIGGDANVGDKVVAVGYASGARVQGVFQVVSEATGSRAGGSAFNPNIHRAIQSQTGAAVCRGDSGGAVVAGGTLVGVLIATAGCSANARALYVRAAAMTGWSHWFAL